MAITPLKYFGAVALITIPTLATTLWCRPSFANAINNHLIQEEMEAKRAHNFKTDYREKDLARDSMLADYVKAGNGHPREFTPTMPTN